MTPDTQQRLRDRAHQITRVRVAREAAALVVAESIEALETNWCKRYVQIWIEAYAAQFALEISGGDQVAARKVLAAREIREAVRHQAELIAMRVNA
jgi:hypothetical protein